MAKIAKKGLPGVSLSIDSGEWNTATFYLQIWLVGLVEIAHSTAGDGLGQALNLVMVDNRAVKHRRGLREERKESKQCQHF